MIADGAEDRGSAHDANLRERSARSDAGPTFEPLLFHGRTPMRYTSCNSRFTLRGRAGRWFLGPRAGSGLDVILGPCRLAAAIASPSFHLPLAAGRRRRAHSTIVRPVFQVPATGSLDSLVLASATARRLRNREARADARSSRVELGTLEGRDSRRAGPMRGARREPRPSDPVPRPIRKPLDPHPSAFAEERRP